MASPCTIRETFNLNTRSSVQTHVHTNTHETDFLNWFKKEIWLICGSKYNAHNKPTMKYLNMLKLK